MTTIRPLQARDLPALVPLHRKAFGSASALADSALLDHLREVFLDNPWSRPGEPDSLVYLSDAGRVVGFIGVFRTEWALSGKPCQVGITSQLMVDRDVASGLPAVQLLRAVFSGPFDLLLTDGATDAVRRLWTGLGGETLLPESLEWVRLLRPGRHFADVVHGRLRGMRVLRPFSSTLSVVPDAIAARLPPNRFHRPTGDLRAETLTNAALAAQREAFAAEWRLAPRYSETELSWLLTQARRHGRHGELRAVLLRDQADAPAGWYLYYLKRGRPAQAVEVASRMALREQVLRHLFRDAWRHGATAIVGRAQAREAGVLGAVWCYFRRAGPWVLVFSRRSDVRLALHSGEAWFSRLDTEYWMQFLGDPGAVVPAQR